MAKGGGSLGRGRKTREETEPIPDRNQLTDLDRRAQTALKQLVEGAGGRWGVKGTKSIPVDAIDVLTDVVVAWIARHSSPHAQTGRMYFSGEPGLWRAFDVLYPLQDPNRWNALRAATTTELEARGYERQGGRNGSTWYAPTTAVSEVVQRPRRPQDA